MVSVLERIYFCNQVTITTSLAINQYYHCGMDSIGGPTYDVGTNALIKQHDDIRRWYRASR